VSKTKSFPAIAAKADFQNFDERARNRCAGGKANQNRAEDQNSLIAQELCVTQQVVLWPVKPLMPLRLLAENCGTPWRKIGLLRKSERRNCRKQGAVSGGQALDRFAR
jgi:hypothetical protein